MSEKDSTGALSVHLPLLDIDCVIPYPTSPAEHNGLAGYGENLDHYEVESHHLIGTI